MTENLQLQEENSMEISNAHPKGALCGNGRFLDAVRVFQVMLQRQATGMRVPSGLKENVYFLINNEQNIFRRGKGKLSRHVDDCGTWSFNASCKSHHYIMRGELLDSVDLREGKYCKQQKNCMVPLSPQPTDEEVITFKRYYVSLKRCPTYRKRVSTIAKCPDRLLYLKKLAVVEYIGKYPSDAEDSEISIQNDSQRKFLNMNDCCGSPSSSSSAAMFFKNNGKFLDASTILQTMLNKHPLGEDIPAGIKENVYFLLDNGQNVTRCANGKQSRYIDDCGLWSVNGKSRYLYYLLRDVEFLDAVVLKDGQYYKYIKGESVPIVPPPTEENVVEFRQYNVNLKEVASYRKRVSMITKCPDHLAYLKHLAVVEYIGKYPTSSNESVLGQQPWNPKNKLSEEFVVCSPDIQSLDMETPSRTDGSQLENGRFLSADNLFNVLLCKNPIGDCVPSGVKENVCFLIDNTQNVTRKANGKKCRYSDDYGSWTVRPSSDVDHYIICTNLHLAHTVVVDGLFCNHSKGKKVPLDPQPTDDDVIAFSRYRGSLKGNPEYRKRITTVIKCPESLAHIKNLAIIEYIKIRTALKENSQSDHPSSGLDDDSSNSLGPLKPIFSQDAINNHGRFLDGNGVYHVMLHGNPINKEALSGLKENLYFLFVINQSSLSEGPGTKCPYVDDCGTWISKPSCKTHNYVVFGNEELDYVDFKNGHYGKEIKGVRTVLEPQPTDQEIITFKRYYGYLKRNPNYKRKISTVISCSVEQARLKTLAVVEYVGSFVNRT